MITQMLLSQLAFDGVANLLLLQKLNILVWSNMHVLQCIWLTSYLSGRQRHVVVHGAAAM